MPVSNIMRIMKSALPPNAKITNASKETVQKCLTEYISLVTVKASARCKRDMRMTLTADDLLWALGHLGFEGFVQPLTEYRDMYRKNEESLKAQDRVLGSGAGEGSSGAGGGEDGGGSQSGLPKF
ncbi:Nuclear transcription factor Y subunit B-1 [Linum grandiflorum]